MYEKNTAIAEEFWKSTNERKLGVVMSLLGSKEYEKLYSLVLGARVIDTVVVKSFGDMFFDKFVSLMSDLAINNRTAVPFLLHCMTSFDKTSSWKECAASYLHHICKIDYNNILNYATDNPDVTLWRTLAASDPEKTTDIMLELLLEKKGKYKTVLRRVLAESKLDIIPVLEEEYSNAPLVTRVGIARLLLMYKKEADAMRLLNKIKETEKSVTVLRILGVGEDLLTFDESCAYNEGMFVVSCRDDSCVFTFDGSEIKIMSATKNGNSLAKKAIRSRKNFLENSLYTGDGVELFALAEAVRCDALFALLCEEFIFAVYNNAGYPIKLFTVGDGEIKGLIGEIDADSDEIVAVTHPAELADSTLQYPTDKFHSQMRRDCFLPSKEEMRLSSIPAFAGAMINMDEAMERAHERSIKVNTVENNYFNVKWGNFYCVNTFTVLKNTISLGNAAFYDYGKLPAAGGKIILKSAVPLTIGSVPPRIFSEFLSCMFYIMRGKRENMVAEDY